MSDNEVLVIFHYDGEFHFDINCPTYKGGKQKMRYLPNDISYSYLRDVALEVSKWKALSDMPALQYLYHDGFTFSLITLEEDEDIKVMFRASVNNTNGLYLYVSKGVNPATGNGQEKPMLQRMPLHGPRKDNSCASREKHKEKEVADATPVREFPTVNLHEDNDIEFSGAPNHVVIDQSIGAYHVVGEIMYDPTVEDEIASDGCEHSQVGRNTTTISNKKQNQANQNKNLEPSYKVVDVNIEDTMVPKEYLIETYQNSAREMWLGRKFSDRDSFRRTLAKFAIYNNFSLKHLKTNRTKVTARCSGQSCPWRIHASIIESGPQFQVRTYNSNHCCSKPMMAMAHRQASSELIAEYVLDRIRSNNDLTPKEIINDFQMEFGCRITYRKAHKAKDIALRLIRGSYEESFRNLPLYCNELQRMNPGTITNIEINDDDTFKRFFWSFGPCIRSFQTSLRPVIAVDGSHLRGKYPGVLLVAVTYDADQKLFPIAFAFAEAERRESWEWFFANLSLALGEPRNLTVVSDRMKGLIPALMNIIPSASHCFCCRHIAENVKSNFKDGAIVRKFWCAAKAYRPCEYEAFLNDIRDVDVSAYNYIKAIGKEHWSNAFVEGRRYDMLTSNAAECTNSLLKDTRMLPVTKQVEEIRAKLMEFYQRRNLHSETINSRLTPYAERILSQGFEESRRLHVRVAGLVEFQVQSTEFIDVVLLDQRKCTCRQWQILGIPCSHAIAAMQLRNKCPYDFCEHWFLTATYRLTYNEVLHATRDIRQWDHMPVEMVLPPHASKQPGRPKKNRIRTEDRDRQRRQVTCSNCKERGHNRQRCRNPPVQ